MLSVVPHCALIPMRPCRIKDILCFIHALAWEHLACIIGQIMSAQHALEAVEAHSGGPISVMSAPIHSAKVTRDGSIAPHPQV